MATTGEAHGEATRGEVVLGYGAAVRGLLHDSPGGPLHPPGRRMREAFQDVRDALERTLHAHTGGLPRHWGRGWGAGGTVASRSHALLWSTVAFPLQTCTRWMAP